MDSRRLFGEADWLILCNPDLGAPGLAHTLGVSESTVRHHRAILRERGWTCSVAYVPCRTASET